MNLSRRWGSNADTDINLHAGFTTPEALRELPKKVEATGIAKIIQTARELVQRVQQDPFYAVLAYKGSKPKKS